MQCYPKQLWIRGGGKSGIHFAEVSVFAGMTGKNSHFRDLSQQVLSGVVEATKTFFVRHESGYPRGPVYKVIVFLSAARGNQELRSVDVDPVVLEFLSVFQKRRTL